MVDYRLKDLRGPSRRNFLKWFGAAGAAIGLERSKLLNVLLDQGGVALADTCAAANRSVHLIGGNGSFAWFQLLWPHVEIADPANASKGFAYHAYGQGFLYSGGDQPFFYGPQAPWVVNGVPTRPMTGFIAGKDETHKPTPTSANAVGVNATMLATCAAIQAPALSALVPMIGVGGFDPGVGFAPGVPSIATVADANSMIGLFNSVSSTTALALQADKDNFDTYYKAYLGLRAAANVPSNVAQVANAKSAAKLLGFNYGPVLTPSAADLAAYGLTALASSGATATQIAGFTNFGMALIVAAKALKNNLTNSVAIGVSPGPTSEQSFTDPHSIFGSASTIASATDALTALGAMLNAFYADLATVNDPACGKSLDKSVVLTVHGDTPKTPLSSSAWPDATPQACNWLYVMGNGYTKNGWYGGVHADGSVTSFNPADGTSVPIAMQDMNVRTYAAGAAAAYAVAQGVKNVVAPFYTGNTPYTGIVN
jgi:hypothetical protein